MQFENVRDVSAKVDKRSNGVVIYEDIEVYSDSNIKELIDAIQREVKNKVGVSTGVTIREVNVKVRNSKKKMKASSTTASVTDRIMESTTETVKPSEESTVAVGESTNQVEQPATTFNSTNNSEPNNTTLS